LVAVLLGVVVAVVLRPHVFSETAPPDPILADPAVATVLAGRQRRAELRALAARDPNRGTLTAASGRSLTERMAAQARSSALRRATATGTSVLA
jgi:hypothetical protein